MSEYLPGTEERQQDFVEISMALLMMTLEMSICSVQMTSAILLIHGKLIVAVQMPRRFQTHAILLAQLREGLRRNANF